jgi:hypothetical protein
MKTFRRIFLLTLLLPIASLLAYWGAKTLPTGPIPYLLSFLFILPNFTGLLLVNSFFPISVSNPTDPFHMITGIMVNWALIVLILALIWFLSSLRRK